MVTFPPWSKNWLARTSLCMPKKHCLTNCAWLSLVFFHETLDIAGVRVAVPTKPTSDYVTSKKWTLIDHYWFTLECWAILLHYLVLNTFYLCKVTLTMGAASSALLQLTWSLQSMLTKGNDMLWSSTTGALNTSCQEQDKNNVAIDSSTCVYGIGVEVLDTNKQSNAAFVSGNGLDAFTNYDWTGGFMHDGFEIGIMSSSVVLPAACVCFCHY